MMNRIKKISNIAFYVSTIFALGVLAKNYYDNSRIEGCPINNNRTWIYISIGMLLATLILSLIISIVEKKQKKSQEGLESASENTEALSQETVLADDSEEVREETETSDDSENQ